MDIKRIMAQDKEVQSCFVLHCFVRALVGKNVPCSFKLTGSISLGVDDPITKLRNEIMTSAACIVVPTTCFTCIIDEKMA